jgi:hypothetical protein
MELCNITFVLLCVGSSSIVGVLFFEVLGLELRAFTLRHSTNLFCEGFFEIGAFGTICLAGFELRSS